MEIASSSKFLFGETTMSSVKAMRLCTGRGQFHKKFTENQLLFFLKPLQIHPQLSNKQALLNPGFSFFKEMHIFLSLCLKPTRAWSLLKLPSDLRGWVSMYKPSRKGRGKVQSPSSLWVPDHVRSKSTLCHANWGPSYIYFPHQTLLWNQWGI